MGSATLHLQSLHNGFITAVDACSSWSFARHSHDEFGIGLLTSGAQRSWSGRGPVEAKKGDVITVNPAEVHDGIPVGTERAWSMLYFAPQVVASVITDLTEGRLSTRELHAPVVEDMRVARLFVATRAAIMEKDRSGAFDELLLKLFGVLFRSASPVSRDVPPRLRHIRERIDDDPASAYSLTDLASLAGLSRFQTLRAFTRLTGLTPHAYMVQRRLDTARQLIRDGSDLADAAAATGFADQSHMHRAFVARYGYTPGTYANALRR